ncbi:MULTISPECIES: KEOPS complex subunit Pcc1 [unclassified Haladaptatus]|uniref:KEOPS complex subunit Pcc1 n=1 Tax=unclassified Haladaptatus TaxID=2622732 RepID=UPI0023E832A3|nr:MULTISPECIES: KEOPS complex subunit Pcc1 [unclassified Haladaptatus]
MNHSFEDAEPLHTAILSFEYETDAYARIVARSVRQELDEIEGDRTTATLTREGATVTVEVGAADLVALRAGCNTWLTLVKTAESLADVGFDAEH